MRKYIFIALFFLSSCGNSPEKEAYEACSNVIKNNLGQQAAFDSKTEKNYGSGDEFYFSWSSGTISNAVRTKPDSLTDSMNPSASCIGIFSNREITHVTVNGDDVISKPISY